MADALGQLLVVAESLQTHTPSDPHMEALACAWEHGEELRQRWQNQPAPASVRSAQHVEPHARNPVSGAQGRTR